MVAKSFRPPTPARYPRRVPADTEIMLLVGGLHLVGAVLAAALILACLRSDTTAPWSPREEGEEGGGGGSDRRAPREPDRPRGGGLPLPDAAPARVRLRGPATLAALSGASRRRRGPEPVRTPVPVRRHRV